ncbi:MAG: NAD-glutamate dehydrogenase [Alphaproteobacteria bacterium]|nr:NAD-glutamate dehydrogenase [Alphaproteobacteria bacterium]
MTAEIVRKAQPPSVSPTSSEDELALDRVHAAESMLPPDAVASGLKAFFERLYRGAPPSDVTRYAPEALAQLAALAFEKTARRRPGEILVDIVPFRAATGAGFRDEAIFIAANDDMPFLFDSLIAELGAEGIRVHALFHPIIAAKRDSAGMLNPSGPEVRESVIVLALDPLGEELRATLIAGAQRIFHQVKLAVRDWRKMLAHLNDTIAALQTRPPKVDAEIVRESIAFLEWLASNHFTFLGARDYAYSGGPQDKLVPVPESGLGVLADVDTTVVRRTDERHDVTAEIQGLLAQSEPLIITKSNEKTVVHRRVNMDYVGVKMFDSAGRLTGERRFVGLFTSGAYSRRPADIPLLRLKVQHVLDRAGLPPDTHDGKALAHILNSFPRDELFQVSDEELFDTALGILRLGERPKVKVFVRCDRFDRFVSILVFVPRDRFDTRVRQKIHGILARAFNGRMSASYPTIEDSILARVHYIVGRVPGQRPKVDVSALEAEIAAAIRTWEDSFAAALIREYGDTEGRQIFARERDAFPARYRDAFTPDEALHDLVELGRLARNDLRVDCWMYRLPDDAASALRLKVYALDGVLPLSASLPVFENLGFRVIAEDSYTVNVGGDAGREAAVLDFRMERADGAPANLSTIKAPFEQAFRAIIIGEAENDGFNRLIMHGGVDWKAVNILRAASKYARQAGLSFSQDYVEQALARNAGIAGLLIELFRARHAPGNKEREHEQSAIAARIDEALKNVPSLDDDRIIRRLRNVIECSLRTNFFQNKPYLSIKLDSRKLDELPAPRPLYEIFVYSPQVEGVHLRFGKVARGGLRWSDRREDFRTEVLGLVKAQQVKNAVIVPVGAKGGFYPKRLPVNGTRDEVQAAAVAAYKTFINALLDLTDNIGADGSLIPPEGVVRHDSDDPYLVVAADKGTATFSDIANGIAEERGFWLGDAFASGGSHGYDHKKMGITARGAWVAVQRHFREMGRDIQTEPFTCIGIGDMSGDVFGNGMLLSKQTRLVAAFDHRHIFIDPDPDPQKSWAERKRMFDLPRSSWEDYDKSLISSGGGVYSRNLKQIPLSAAVQKLTGIASAVAAPAEVMKALLKADVDLLWFGGIGTYVKAESQNNLDVGDRANDAIRVNGTEIRAKVIGEGANLGATQPGRVEYALKGGRINTDAIDNSAGVDTSDHEVNLKILMAGPLRRGELSPAERDNLLEQMTDDVAGQVLEDNYDQTLALSVSQWLGMRDLDSHGRFLRDLERRGKLDRAVEYLPDDVALRRRAQSHVALTRPELAVLLAYAKLDLDAELLASELPDDPYFTPVLAAYYPKAAAKRFEAELQHHRLRREIICTAVTNRIVNLAGPVFVHRMKEVSGASAVRVARAFAAAEGAFGLEALKTRIDTLDSKIPAETQTMMYAEIAEMLRRIGLWFLTNVPASADLRETTARYRMGVDALRGTYSTLISKYELDERMAYIGKLMEAGVPEDLAHDVAALPLWSRAPEIAMLAHARELNIDLVAGAYFAVGTTLELDRLRHLGARISVEEHWDRLAVRRIVDDLFASQRALTDQALRESADTSGDGARAEGVKAAQIWANAHAEKVERTRNFLHELERGGDLTIAKLTLANSQIRELADV